MSRNVSVSSESAKYGQSISVGPHILHSDEPNEIGGADEGPTAVELLMAALGACTSTTVQMFAEHRQWPLRGVHIDLSYDRVPSDDYGKSDSNIGMMDRITAAISFTGDLSDDQQQKLLDIASHCPVHRMLVSQVEVRQKLLVPTSTHSS